MTKTPEEYFQEQEFRSEPATREDSFTEAEKAFLEKYLGLEEPDILEKLGIEAPVEPRSVSVPEPEVAPESEPEATPEPAAVDEVSEAPEVVEQPEKTAAEVEPVAAVQEATPATGEEEDTGEDEATEAAVEGLAEKEPTDSDLQLRDSLQLVSFMVRHQEYTLPIDAVQEVVRAVKPTQVPEAPSYMAGLVNLRGRVTPLVKLDALLGIEQGKKLVTEEGQPDDGEDKFIVVCRKKGLQVGLQVRQVTTMYRISQEKIEWNIESRLGGTQEQLVTALMRKDDDTLVGILSIDKIVERIMTR